MSFQPPHCNTNWKRALAKIVLGYNRIGERSFICFFFLVSHDWVGRIYLDIGRDQSKESGQGEGGSVRVEVGEWGIYIYLVRNPFVFFNVTFVSCAVEKCVCSD